MPTLLFILADRLSRLADKGEVTARYYNPGDVFDEVHLLTTSNDLVAPARLAVAAGAARLHVHRLWAGDDRLHLALAPLLARRWARRAVALARRVGADVVRTGDRITGYLGARVKAEIGIPHVLSLHAHREVQIQILAPGPRRWLVRYERRYARYSFPRADRVIVVYESLKEYAREYGAKTVDVIYNTVSPEQRHPKQSYSLSSPPTIVSVGRIVRGKMPDQLVRALSRVNARLVLIGSGEGLPFLRRLVAQEGLTDRVEFRPSVANAELCTSLPGFDLFAAHSLYPEIPKTVLEALWLGLPVVVNNDQIVSVPEYSCGCVVGVPNSVGGYVEAIQRLLSDEVGRERLGRAGRRYAEATFDPERMEACQADLYRELLARSRAPTAGREI